MTTNKILAAFAAVLLCLSVYAGRTYRFGDGTLTVTDVAANAVRIRYAVGTAADTLPDWLYVQHDEAVSTHISVLVDEERQTVTVTDASGRPVFTATRHHWHDGKATLAFTSPADESLFGLGQFQDGYADVRGLTRRLTQVNTQISIPMLLSSKGYGILWNNYGLTDYNPADRAVSLTALGADEGAVEVVNVTGTSGGRQERRRQGSFAATFDIVEEGDYALMLDVGQSMARRHHLVVDGETVIDMRNFWLPPTASTIVRLTAGRHSVAAELSDGDRPVLYLRRVTAETVFSSPVSTAVDYTVFVGTPDEVVATYRQLTGRAPLMPRWALGYIHCRERFHSSDEILSTARRFRDEQLPVSVLVQDWQYWGRYGWNAMRFDEANYPDPRALTDSLHDRNIRLMLSVWSKIDRNSDVGHLMAQGGHYIPGTDWIDFFKPSSAAA